MTNQNEAFGLLLSVSVANFFDTLFSNCTLPIRNDLGNLRIANENEHNWNMKVAPNGYLLVFNCEPGFTISGHQMVTCNEGKWTADFPSCIELPCPSPPKIAHTRRFVRKPVDSTLTVGSAVRYRCVKGFDLVHENASSLKCGIRGNRVVWEGIMPECVENSFCSDPGVSKDGGREGKCCDVGAKLTFSCNENYELIGDEEIECLEGAIWSSPRPRCRPLEENYCPDPPYIPNGSIVSIKKGDYYVSDDDAMVKCDAGYSPKGGSIIISCEKKGQWDSTFARCKEVFCERPPDLENGTIPQLKETDSILFPYRFELTPKCNDGFRLIGDHMRLCGSIGWSGKTPYCEVIRCYDPGHPEFGRREGHIFEIGSKVAFSCFAGYSLIGSEERLCLENGQWSGQLTKCNTKSNYCPDPGTPINGWKSGNRYDQEETIKYGCDTGFFLLGSEERKCQENHLWTGFEPICRSSHYFDGRASIAQKLIRISQAVAKEQMRESKKYQENLKKIHSSGHESSGQFHFQMSRNTQNYPKRIILYFMFDASGSIGKEDFRTSIEFAKVLVKQVGISPNGARAGAMTFGSTTKIKFLPMQYNSTEDVLGALDRIQKSQTGLTSTSPRILPWILPIEPYFPVPPSGENGTTTAWKLVQKEMIPLAREYFGKGGKSVIFLLTDGKFNLAGETEQYSREVQDPRVQIFYIGIAGNINQTFVHKIATKPTDFHVFILKDYETLALVAQDIINGTIVSDCSQCRGDQAERSGVQGRIVGGDITRKYWPWMAAVYYNGAFRCGGSIISRNTILTAAHCVFDRNGNVLESITVKLGLRNLNNLTYLQQFETSNIVPHEDYDKHTTDFDIALIKLRRNIIFTSDVNKIDIPTKGDLQYFPELYKAGKYVYAIGWGITQKRCATDRDSSVVNDLREVYLPLQSRRTCCNYISNLPWYSGCIFTENMFCAGDGKGTKDTCQGDSGSPVMQYLEGSIRNAYAQIGIVSWGIGCARENTYGFYTHASHLRNWIVVNGGLEVSNGSPLRDKLDNMRVPLDNLNNIETCSPFWN